MKKRDDIDFIARHYRHGRFSVNDGWKRLGIDSPSRLRPIRTAAAIAVAVVMTAAAALIYHNYQPIGNDTTPEAPTCVENINTGAGIAKIIDFENTPLTQVVEQIERVYEVKVTGMPADAGTYRLSLHYEGTAADLLETINEILGTDLKLEKQ